jgi:hypothetical protein
MGGGKRHELKRRENKKIIQNCKYNSVGADLCVRPSKGPYCLFKTINRVDTWVDPYKFL